ncbi:hypothetical protein Ga0100231_011275 [Opitutaceae bacterium TAV4]|nr:hypothetical protein Ga0100231_011275 [Opitutaceae bacterium TAV4]
MIAVPVLCLSPPPPPPRPGPGFLQHVKRQGLTLSGLPCADQVNASGKNQLHFSPPQGILKSGRIVCRAIALEVG